MKYVEIINNIYKNLDTNKQYLNDLDQAIGDGDHGTNIVRGFQAVNEVVATWTTETIPEQLKRTAMLLMSKIGGTSGPLLGTMLLQMSMNWTGESLSQITKAIEAGLKGIQMLGKAELNDKTMVDALYPIVESMKVNQDKTIHEFFKLAADAGKIGADNTIMMLAKKGRASYLNERSINHLDPGAFSMYLIFKSISEVV